jgi:ribosome maturation factor RimP
MATTSADALLPTVGSIVAKEGVDLEGLEVVQQGRRRIVRIMVDADGGVDVDRCADVSRAVSRAFDDAGTMGETPYTLEVSSRGVSRPLTEPRHWRRNVGRMVRITPYDGDSYVGRILVSDDAHVTLDVDGTERDVAYPDIRRAKVQVEFSKTDDDSEEG